VDSTAPDVRPFEPADIDAVNDLLATHYPWTEYEASFTINPETLGDAGEALVASVDGTFAGFVWWLPDGAFGRSGYVKLVGVHRDHQSGGVGTTLMDAAETALFDAGGRTDVFLLVSAFNDGARRFYDHRGYEQVGTIEDYVEEGTNEVLLRKRIASQSDQNTPSR